MITEKTAARIWTCYREIAAGKKLLKDGEVALADNPHEDPFPRDPFGQKRGLQLGIPSGNTSHRLFDVPPQLAFSVIRAHIAEQERMLKEANEQARIELEFPL